jgi:hypothetical protein
MIWVHGPRYLQATYPDHETLARYDWFAVICALILVGLFEKDRAITARGLAGRSARRTQVTPPESLAMRLGHCQQHAICGPCSQIMKTGNPGLFCRPV